MKSVKLILIFMIPLFFFACSGEEEIEKYPELADYFDPGKPIAFETMSPSWGRIDQTFVIKGNFPTDLEKIKVYFDTRRAVLINCDGRELMGMVPKQAPGNNSVSLVVGNDSIVPQHVQFRYYQTQSVTTVVGKFEDDRFLEGNLDEARVQKVTGLGVVNGQAGNNLLVVEGDWADRISFVSFDDNRLMRLTGIGYMGAVAVDNTGDRACVVARGGNRMIYTASRADGWTLNPTGITMSIPGDIHGGMTFGEDNRYLYFINNGIMQEVDLEQKTVTTLFEKANQPAFDGVNLGSWWQYLTYSKYDKAFFASFADANGIFKIWKDTAGKWQVEKFAGFRSGSPAFGDRLNDAVLNAPCGMAVNSQGELYVCLKGSHCIAKIKGRLVSLVAGKPGSYGKVNGYPLESYFDQPSAIAIDSDENFYIGEVVTRVVRKMTIE